MKGLSPGQKRALAWLAERGGSGVLDRYGTLVAQGEKCPAAPQTWLRLFLSGHAKAVDGRIVLVEGAPL